MNVIELMDAKASSFSKNDTKIYESIKKFPDQFADCSISEISSASGFTKAALTRFAQKLGYSGYTEFQFYFSKDKEELSNVKTSRLADIYSKILQRTEEFVDNQQLNILANRILTSANIYLKGSNLSRLPAEELNMAMRIAVGKTPNLIQADVETINFNQDDILILYSSRSGDSHSSFCKQLRDENKVRPYSILVTVSAKHPLRHNFDEVVVLPSAPLSEAKDAQLSDTFSFLFFNDLLVHELQELLKNKERSK